MSLKIYLSFVLIATVALAQSLTPQVNLMPAPTVYLPGGVIDSNSPVWWSNGQMRGITSRGDSLLFTGMNQFLLNPMATLGPESMGHAPFWMESVWRDRDGVLFGWYHHEPGGICPKLTAPMIGAAFSQDEGETWHDIGIVLTAGDPPDCNSKNGFFAGGHGDFSVIPDRQGRFLYFFFGNYAGADQGIAVARMAVSDRWAPIGGVWKYRDGRWIEPGLGGRVTPVFRAAVDWQKTNTDSFWGPSIHWNSYLQSYVILMNRSCCGTGWPQAGIHATFNRDLSRPGAWSEPVKILQPSSRPGWYPQVIGMGPGETDTVSGQMARLYVAGISHWQVEFVRPAGINPRPGQTPQAPRP